MHELSSLDNLLYAYNNLSVYGPFSLYTDHPFWTETIIFGLDRDHQSPDRPSSEHMDHSLYTLTIFFAHKQSSMYMNNPLYTEISFPIHGSFFLH